MGTSRKSVKSFIVPITGSIKSVQNTKHKGNVCKKKFRTEIITPFFVSFLNQQVLS